MESIYLDHPKGKVHALRFGNGPTLLIALHGFGDRARLFSVLAEALGPNYTTVAVDLPFHGQTTWNDTSFTKEDLLLILRQLTHTHDQFALMGFSFGARLAQAMLPELQDRLNKLILLSPDGINTRGMRLAVHTPMWMRRVLFRALQKPDWFLNLLSTGRKMGVVPPLIQHFLAANLSKTDRFRRTFGCWFALNKFYLPRRAIRAIWATGKFPVDLYFGAKDEMIRFKSVQKMVVGLPHVQLHMLDDEGHRVVGEVLQRMMAIGN